MADRKYFLLQEPISAAEAGSFLCRVVTSKTSPATKFAPFSMPGAQSHNSNDIIPSILPEPSLSTIDEHSLSVARERGISIQLTALLGLNFSRSNEETRTLKSTCVRRYTLPNPQSFFEELMKNEAYARDVHALLDEIWPHNAYLITGFLTATDSNWVATTKQGTTKGLNINIPLSEIAAVPLSGLADTGIAPEWSSSTEESRTTSATGEEIFAVSYSTVKLSYKLSGSGSLFKPTPRIGRPKRAKAHHLAFGDDDDEESDYEDSPSTSGGDGRATKAVELDNDSGSLTVLSGELWISVT
jgi:hypothetical protein